MRRVVVSCFDKTGNMVWPWADAGYECHIVDMQHPPGRTVEGNIVRWGMDVREWETRFAAERATSPMHIVFAAFFPPCTDLAVSGARWFAEKERKSPGTRARAMELVHWSHRVGTALACPFLIENPVSVISTEWRPPDYSFHPFWYGGYAGGSEDGYTKKTCLWTGGGFALPEKKPIALDPKTHNRIHLMPPGPERQNLRSQTPRGFARAVFETVHSSAVLVNDASK